MTFCPGFSTNILKTFLALLQLSKFLAILTLSCYSLSTQVGEIRSANLQTSEGGDGGWGDMPPYLILTSGTPRLLWHVSFVHFICSCGKLTYGALRKWRKLENWVDLQSSIAPHTWSGYLLQGRWKVWKSGQVVIQSLLKEEKKILIPHQPKCGEGRFGPSPSSDGPAQNW